MKITLDTNVIPAEPIINSGRGLGFDFKVTSVTDRELEPFDKKHGLPSIYEAAVWGESRFGAAVFASEETGRTFEDILSIISNGSFPPKMKREKLTTGQQRQLRDAMILEAHIREKRDIFITLDKKAFMGSGDTPEKIRDLLWEKFQVRIMTPDEFQKFCKQQHELKVGK